MIVRARTAPLIVSRAGAATDRERIDAQRAAPSDGRSGGEKSQQENFEGRLTSTCHWAADLVVVILTSRTVSISAEVRVERSRSSRMVSDRAANHHSYVVFQDETGLERALVHGDDVYDYKRTLADGIVAGELIITTPDVVEAYWQQLDDRAAEVTAVKRDELAGESTDAEAVEAARAWARGFEHVVRYPVFADEAAREQGFPPDTGWRWIEVPASAVLEQAPTALLADLYRRSRMADAEYFFVTALPELLEAIRKSETERAQFVSATGVAATDLFTDDPRRALDVLAEALRVSQAQHHGEANADQIHHPTIC